MKAAVREEQLSTNLKHTEQSESAETLPFVETFYHQVDHKKKKGVKWVIWVVIGH